MRRPRKMPRFSTGKPLAADQTARSCESDRASMPSWFCRGDGCQRLSRGWEPRQNKRPIHRRSTAAGSGEGALAEKRAAEEDRSLASYISRLIEGRRRQKEIDMAARA